MPRIILAISLFVVLCTPHHLLGQGKVTQYEYYNYEYGNNGRDTSVTDVLQLGDQIQIAHRAAVNKPIPGYCSEITMADRQADSVTYCFKFDDSSYFYKTPMSRKDIEWDTQKIDSKTTRYVTSINSNRIELLFTTDGKNHINPLPHYGHFDGVMRSMSRNGLIMMEYKGNMKKPSLTLVEDYGQRKTQRELSAMKRNRMVLTTHVFKNQQIHWGAKCGSVSEVPYDTTLHFAGGTVILKRLNMQRLPAHYQTFIELRQHSNGDAYDRTGSVFVIPDAAKQGVPTFFDGMNYHPDSLPVIHGRDGERYQGIVPAKGRMKQYADSKELYHPPVELMRFFTPFGIGKYNEKVKLEGLEWEDETLYKQEVTELQSLLEGDVWIGVFIGNYDGGGHMVSLDIKSYPNDYEWLIEEPRGKVTSLVNTCNVLEMAGQNYGKLFVTDSITVSFHVDSDTQQLHLRYISTGHGGWGGGDEFNPKENIIMIDGERRFCHTPWRCDCGRYREWNPVSGNFWNGLSSSDFSRSGWCPGTATQPVYFDLTGLSEGDHTLTIAIPQGKPTEGGFSHWGVSACLIEN